MGLFDNFKISSPSKKEEPTDKIKPVVARWEVSLTCVCPICTTKIDLDRNEMDDIGVNKLLEAPKRLKSDSIECPMCNLPIMIKEIQKKPKLRGDMRLDSDMEVEEEQELDFGKTTLDDLDNDSRPDMNLGEDDDWDY